MFVLSTAIPLVPPASVPRIPVDPAPKWQTSADTHSHASLLGVPFLIFLYSGIQRTFFPLLIFLRVCGRTNHILLHKFEPCVLGPPNPKGTLVASTPARIFDGVLGWNGCLIALSQLQDWNPPYSQLLTSRLLFSPQTRTLPPAGETPTPKRQTAQPPISPTKSLFPEHNHLLLKNSTGVILQFYFWRYWEFLKFITYKTKETNIPTLVVTPISKQHTCNSCFIAWTPSSHIFFSNKKISIFYQLSGWITQSSVSFQDIFNNQVQSRISRTPLRPKPLHLKPFFQYFFDFHNTFFLFIFSRSCRGTVVWMW